MAVFQLAPENPREKQDKPGGFQSRRGRRRGDPHPTSRSGERRELPQRGPGFGGAPDENDFSAQTLDGGRKKIQKKRLATPEVTIVISLI